MTQTYTAAELNDLFTIVFEEADSSIEKSFSEGYKAGLLDSEPRSAALEERNAYLVHEIESLNKKGLIQWWTIPVAFAVGFVAGELFEVLR